MKHLVLILSVVMLSCLKSSATPYAIPITGSGSYNLLGSQFITTETVTSYSTSPSDFDQVLFWDVPSQDFSPAISTYSAAQGQWDQNPPIPLGKLSHSAFFYVRNASDTTFNRNITPVVPTPLPAMLPNFWYALSSQTPVNAQYGDLVGVPGTDTPPGLLGGTYVMRWDITTFDFQTVWRYGPASQWWRYASGTVTPYTGPFMIPQFEGAFVGRFTATAPCSPAPSLQTVTASGCCAPNVTLTLTFLGNVDVITAGIPANYVISLGGLVTGVTVQTVNTTIPGTSGMIMPTATSVVLTVKLMTQCGNTYTVSAPGVRCLSGTAVTGTLPFSLNGCGSAPVNDTVSTATPLTSGVAVNGSLKLANCTPLGVVRSFPAGAGANAKDEWYSFTPSSSGVVTIDTCQPLATGCPNITDTALAVYTGYPGALDQQTLTVNIQDLGAGCVNTKAARVQFNAQTCKTYYIRVSGKASGVLPGDFSLLLVHTPTAPANNACSAFTLVSANSSTAFNNVSATTDGPATETIHNDVWFRFKAPSGTGPFPTTVETCSANFDTYIAVYNGSCPTGPALFSNDNDLGGCSPQSKVTFMASASQFYYVRVGGKTITDKGCGFLHVSSGIPATAPTIPSPGSTYCRTYKIFGTATAVTWQWSLTAPAPCNLNISGSAGPVAGGSTALAIATAFAASINAILPGSASFANVVPTRPEEATLKICTPCTASGLVLKVGPVTPSCWVEFLSLPVAFGPCNFNPDIFEIGNPDGLETDCNTNGVADYLDISNGTSADVDGDGVPDECEGCVSVAVADGPLSMKSGIGGNATFSAQAVGSGPFSYQWNKGGVTLSGQTNATLILTNLTLNAADLYDVTVSNICSRVTSPAAVLYVDPLPVVNITKVGNNVVLSWSDAGYHLQANLVLNNSAGWTDITNASPVIVPLTNAARFFRLQQ